MSDGALLGPAASRLALQSDNDQLIKELQGKNAELEKRLSTEGSRKDEQVGPTCK